MVRAVLATLGLSVVSCDFPDYRVVDAEPTTAAGSASGGTGGVTQTGGTIGATAGAGASPAGGTPQAGGGEAAAGEAGQGGAPIVDPFLNVDLRGSCNGGIPTGDGQTEVVTALEAYDLTAYGSEPGHHCGEDQARFMYLEITGDFDVAVQVASMDNFDAPEGVLGNPAKAGLMMREGLGPTARFVAILAIEPKPEFPDCFVFDHRSQPGGKLGLGGFDYAWLNRDDAIFQRDFPNIWVRLLRVGRSVFGFASEDGDNWLETSRTFYQTDFSPKVYLGVVASSAAETGYNARSVTSFRKLRGFAGL